MGEQDRSPHNCAKKVKIEAETGIDWISALPDSLIVEILSKIPITDACTTTILSKRWQNMWTCNHDLNCYPSKTSTGWSAKRFISFIHNALPLLTSSKIESFTLHFRSNIALSNYSSKLDKWLEIVLKKKVENLDLDLRGCDDFFGYYLDSDLYSLPQELCSSSSLVKLKFKFCKIPEDRKLNWTSLKSLTLTFVLLSDEHMKQITSNCHHLESFKLCYFCGFHRLHLTSPKCTTLELSNHTHPLNYMGDECYFEIVAPYVQYFRISENFEGVGIRLGDLSSLIHADLTYNLYDDRGLDDVIDKSIVKDHLTSVYLTCKAKSTLVFLTMQPTIFDSYKPPIHTYKKIHQPPQPGCLIHLSLPSVRPTGKTRISMASNFHFFLLYLVTLFLFAQARLNLYPQDHAALLLVQKDLGIIALNNPCTLAGISCERRPGNRTQVLRVTRIVFRSNGLKGTLSSAIGKLSELKELSLSDNQLSEQIPIQILDCRKLEILELQRNRFSGKIPYELSSLNRLRVVDFSSNEFSGNLDFLKYFPNLEKLSLADNMFTGKIPFSLKSFRNLRFLNISGNSFLEGPVPVMSQIEHLSADLNRNNAVPKRYILAENSTRSNQISAMGPAPASAPVNRVVPVVHKRNKKKKKLRSWFLGFLAGTFAGGISAVIFSLLFKLVMFFVRRGKNDSSSLTIFSPLIKKAEDLAFLEMEDGVASLEMIGKGGCGEVYRAELPGSNGKIIAIKKIIQSPMDAAEITEEDTKALNKKMRQVKSEIQIVGQIRHRNLLPLLAHMPRPDCHYLVYEYMKNGSLQDILQQVTEGTRELDWLGRHRIAAGVAAGLEYLHINHTQRIIHRDLKPANILLDDDMEARIADFGLAKAVPDAHTHITTSNVAGTMGYIAPEYYQTLKFTDKCDIYSFGVVLAVLVIGKGPSDEYFQHTSEMSLVKWLRNVMTSDDPKIAIDPKLRGNGYEEQMLLVLKIACFCTLDNPKERPSSKDVRCMLTQIKH